MRIVKIVFIALSLFSIVIHSADLKDQLQKANEFYVNGNFDEAIKIYESIIEQGYEGASLFYNLGNAYYRTGKIGYAILYYEKALKHSRDDEDILHNLQLARLNIKDKIEPIPSFFLFQIWEGILAALNVNGWTLLSYILFLLTLFALGFYFFAKNIATQRVSFYSFIVLLIFFLFSVSILVVKINQEAKLKFGIVLNSSLTAKTSPDPQGKDAFLIHEGLKVTVEDKIDHWLKIRLADGQVGWVTDNSIGII